MENEIWKDVKGYEGLYQVSNFGRIKSLEKIRKMPISNYDLVFPEKIIVPFISKKRSKYPNFRICYYGKIKTVSIHRLVAEAFIPNPDKKPQVNHINGDTTDNRVENLEWCTRSENQIHALNIGLNSNKGHTHYNSKLSDDQVYQIKYEMNNITQREIAKKFGVCFQTISLIRKNKVWKHI